MMLEYVGVCEIEIKPTELFSGLNEQPNVHSLQIVARSIIIPAGCADGGMLASSVKTDIVVTPLSTILERGMTLALKKLVGNSYSLILSFFHFLTSLTYRQVKKMGTRSGC